MNFEEIVFHKLTIYLYVFGGADLYIIFIFIVYLIFIIIIYICYVFKIYT